MYKFTSQTYKSTHQNQLMCTNTQRNLYTIQHSLTNKIIHFITFFKHITIKPLLNVKF